MALTHRCSKWSITASEARKNLFPSIEQVNADRQPIEITSNRGDAVLMSTDDYRALEETAFLLRSPANVRRLLASIDQARRGSMTRCAVRSMASESPNSFVMLSPAPGHAGSTKSIVWCTSSTATT